MFASRVWAALKARPLSEIVGYGVILVRNALGLPNRMRTPDRDTLEQVILPAYAARSDIKTVLFVGCAWYTRHYERMLPGRVYWTIDPDPWKKRFGARRHIVAGLESVDAHIAPAQPRPDHLQRRLRLGPRRPRRLRAGLRRAASTRCGPRANLSSDGTTFQNTGRWSWPACNPWRASVR